MRSDEGARFRNALRPSHQRSLRRRLPPDEHAPAPLDFFQCADQRPRAAAVTACLATAARSRAGTVPGTSRNRNPSFREVKPGSRSATTYRRDHSDISGNPARGPDRERRRYRDRPDCLACALSISIAFERRAPCCGVRPTGSPRRTATVGGGRRPLPAAQTFAGVLKRRAGGGGRNHDESHDGRDRSREAGFPASRSGSGRHGVF